MKLKSTINVSVNMIRYMEKMENVSALQERLSLVMEPRANVKVATKLTLMEYAHARNTLEYQIPVNALIKEYKMAIQY